MQKNSVSDFFRKIRERIRLYAVKNPSQTILIAILILNIVLFALSAAIISALAPKSLEHSGFWASVYYTVSMVFDAGCIQYVVADIGEASVALIIICMLTVVIGMITFTGAVIGYVTNIISNFIENSKSGNRALKISDHTVILNWNSRASEIVNDLLYTGKREVVVILVSEGHEAVEREIGDRISASMKEDAAQLQKASADMPFFARQRYRRRYRTRNRLTVIVREGETYSTKQLNDVSISQAETVIILTKDVQNSLCDYGNIERRDTMEKGNANTIKTLVQVAQMTADENSADHQTIIVEVEDKWTGELVNRIIAHKQVQQKCVIVPIMVNKVLGQILSQFSIMPELNTVYSELFSNRGAEFFYRDHEWVDDVDKTILDYLDTHHRAVPLTILKTNSGNHAYYVADSIEDCETGGEIHRGDFKVAVDEHYHLEARNIVIIGHNSKSEDIMNGFNSFRDEHQLARGEILNITVIDEAKSLEKLDNYSKYPYVTKTVPADVYDAALIRSAIKEALAKHKGDTSILVLSDDNVRTEDIDSAALTYLIYVQDIIKEFRDKDPDFDVESIDVVVEIINPKNYDVVHNYSVNNVVISNRYISKMVTQIGRKQPLFEFYTDILTYDDKEASEAETFESKELYIKEVRRFFKELPGPCTAAELIRATYESSPENNKAMVLGYVSPGGRTVLFSGDQWNIKVNLTERDKLIIFSNH